MKFSNDFLYERLFPNFKSSLLENKSYDHMIDGRCVHFFFLLLHPVLCKIHPDCVATEEDSDVPIGFFLPRKEKLVLSGYSFITIEVSGIEIYLYSAPGKTLDSAATKKLYAAIKSLEQASFAWLVNLSIGNIVIHDIECTKNFYSVNLSSSQLLELDSSSLAELLIKGAAINFISSFIRSEKFIYGISSDFVERFSTEFCDAITLCWAARANIPHSLTAMGDWTAASLDFEFRGFPLTKHIFSLWLPQPDRWSLIAGSPYDYLTCLADFKEKENT